MKYILSLLLVFTACGAQQPNEVEETQSAYTSSDACGVTVGFFGVTNWNCARHSHWKCDPLTYSSSMCHGAQPKDPLPGASFTNSYGPSDPVAFLYSDNNVGQGYTPVNVIPQYQFYSSQSQLLDYGYAYTSGDLFPYTAFSGMNLSNLEVDNGEGIRIFTGDAFTGSSWAWTAGPAGSPTAITRIDISTYPQIRSFYTY